MLDALTVQIDPTLKEKEKTMAINSNAITVEANKPARFNAQPPSKDNHFDTYQTCGRHHKVNGRRVRSRAHQKTEPVKQHARALRLNLF